MHKKHIIPHQQKIQYLRIILTNECNLNCHYCHREGMNYEKKELTADEIVKYTKLFYDIGIKKFKLMGGEPTLRSDLTNIIKGMRKIAAKADISMITNGHLIMDKASGYVDAGLDRINISVHTWRPTTQALPRTDTDKSQSEFKKTILWLKEQGILTKINFVILKGINEKEAIDLIEWCNKYNIVLDMLNVIYSSKDKNKLQDLHYSFVEIENFIDGNFKIDEIKIQQNNYSLPSTRIFIKNGTQINLKTSRLNTEMVFNHCRECNELDFCVEGIKAIRLTNKGLIQPCLFHKNKTYNIKALYDAKYPYHEIAKKTVDYINEL